MKMNVPSQTIKNIVKTRNYFSCLTTLFVVFFLLATQFTSAQKAIATTKLTPVTTPTTVTTGTWTALTNQAPNGNEGVMVLMTDGTVMCHNDNGGADEVGTGWDKLTPDATGSYVNGTWSSGGSMFNDRLFFASQVMPNGELFVSGGEYGTGDTAGEVYNPVTNTWKRTEGVTGKQNISDGNSEILPNGNILVGPQDGTDPSYNCLYYSNSTNKWSTAPTAPQDHDEAQWVKLPDSSILFIGIGTENTCRFRPQTLTWINDANTTVEIFDSYLYESGCGVMLPNGKAIFFGATQYNAIYTPSGTTANGTWTAAADFPKIGTMQVGQPDAPGAMMVNGIELLAVSPSPVVTENYNSPAWFLEYNYQTNVFTQVTGIIPTLGADSIQGGDSYMVNLLDLPDGNVLMSIAEAGLTQYWIYTPATPAIAAGKPTINSILPDACPSYKITGKLFNGISEGASYGDDWQMSSNYPLVRLTSTTTGDVYYAKTTDWNRIGAVATDSVEDTAVFTTPATLPAGTYSLVVVVNGFASNPTMFTTLQATAALGSDANCGSDNGSASSSVTGGITPYTYSWTGGGTNATATGLGAGTYTVTVTDLNGCTATAKVDIAQNSTLGLSANAGANIKCEGETDGVATATVSGGTTPYTYLWTGGKTTSAISGLAAGTYTVGVNDNSGCSGSATVIITSPAALSAVALGTNANCGEMGSASSNVSGGTTPYTYSWTGGKTTSTITGLGAGTYTLGVTDNNGCTQSASVVITQSAGITVSANTTANVTCGGLDDGSATATASGGTAPYTYSWTAAAGNLATATGLSAGTYTITIKDNNGCSGTASVIITQPVAMDITTAYTSASSGACNGQASVTVVSGGTAPYTYSWNNSTSSTTASISNQCSGTYCCIVTDNNGCSQSTCVNISTGIENINNASNINIYPDPSRGSFTIAGVTQGEVIELYNVLGQQLNSIKADQPTMYFNISNQADGIYLIRILNTDGSLVTQKKIVKTQ